MIKKALLFLILFFMANVAGAVSIQVTWNANTEVDLAGYNVFYVGPTDPGWVQENGQWKYTLSTLPHEISGITATSYLLTDVAVGPWAFGITAFDTSNNESAISNIATVLVPNVPAVIVVPPIDIPPAAPVQIQIQLNR